MITIKTSIVLFFVLIAVTPVWAQEGGATLRDLAVGKVFQYARSLYDRGNYEEAGKAFNHILRLDPHHKKSIAYMQKLGLEIPEASKVEAPVPDKLGDIDDVSSHVPSGSNDDIRRRIAQEDQAIAQLKTELPVLRAGMESIPQ